jgi:hypothetical protein
MGKNKLLDSTDQTQSIVNSTNKLSAAVRGINQLKDSVILCHSALDAESSLLFFWIPASAGMTILIL